MMQAQGSPLINNQDSQWTIKGFMDRFDELIKESKTYTQAYFAAEEEHLKLFKKTRYSSYESFRDARRRWVFDKT
jgi:hypothetical protein